MTRQEFISYLDEDGCCVVQGNMVRNTINGRYTRLDESFDEEGDLHAVHHICVLGIAPPDELEDLYHVYSPIYWKLVNSTEPLVIATPITIPSNGG